jgi:hypothetical protein
MDFTEAFVSVTALIAVCIMLAQVVRSIFGASRAGAGDHADSLTQGEVEGMIRRAVREEIRREVQPLRKKLERIEKRGDAGKQPPRRRDLPEEDPHDFGLIADDPAEAARKERVA